MPTGTVTEEIGASSVEVFALLHDYSRRLEWDTLLSAAYLEPPATHAAQGTTSVCVGKRHLGRIAIRTRYVAFRSSQLAAVEMLNQPPFFESFAASIRHQELGPTRSSATYRFTFLAKPWWLRFMLHPVMQLVFRLETQKRLRSLRRFFTARHLGP